jgi:nucleoid DNA-binding protein
MDITPIVKKLLLKYDFVVLPGLGAFTNKYNHAEVDNEKNIFLPPQQHINFNDKIKHDDEALLADAVSEEKKVSKQDAEEIVKDYVNDLNKKLQKGVEIEFSGIGKLFVDKEKGIQFNDTRDEKIPGNIYGLPSFRSSPVHDKKQIQQKPYKKPASKAPKKKAKWPYAVLGFVVLLIIGGIVILYPGISDKETGKKEKQEVLTVAKEKKDKEEEKIEQVLDEQTKKEHALIPKEDKYAQYSRFAVVVGSFTSQQNAEKMKNEMARKGFRPEVIQNDNYYRVSLFTYKNRDKALEKYNHLKADRDIEVWIYNIK